MRDLELSMRDLKLMCWCGAGPIVSPIDVKAATDNRDSLAKTLYSRMFDWLVDKVNTSIGQDPNAVSLVGVLDIYGMPRLRNTISPKTQSACSLRYNVLCSLPPQSIRGTVL